MKRWLSLLLAFAMVTWMTIAGFGGISAAAEPLWSYDSSVTGPDGDWLSQKYEPFNDPFDETVWDGPHATIRMWITTDENGVWLHFTSSREVCLIKVKAGSDNGVTDGGFGYYNSPSAPTKSGVLKVEWLNHGGQVPFYSHVEFYFMKTLETTTGTTQTTTGTTETTTGTTETTTGTTETTTGTTETTTGTTETTTGTTETTTGTTETTTGTTETTTGTTETTTGTTETTTGTTETTTGTTETTTGTTEVTTVTTETSGTTDSTTRETTRRTTRDTTETTAATTTVTNETTTDGTTITFSETTPPQGAPSDPGATMLELTETVPLDAPVLPKTGGIPAELFSLLGVGTVGMGLAFRMAIKR